MDSLVSGTLAGAGSFRCETCGYVVTVAATESLGPCPSCQGRQFARASLYAAGRFEREQVRDEGRAARVAAALNAVPGAGRFFVFPDGEELTVVALDREQLRVGRSLTAEIRFDDQTVSRRHALIMNDDDGVRVLDDRSLNGVFVNGERVEMRTLNDGDEVVIGRHRLTFVEALTSPLNAVSGMRSLAD